MNNVILTEEWRDIKGYEGYYQISNKSRVKSLARKRHKTKHGKGGWLKERILKQSVNSDGYFTVVLTKKGIRKPYKVHRLVAKYFIPNKEGKPEVNHIDGDKLNNDIGNLEWVTKAENVRHAYKNNLNPVKLNISKSDLVSLIEKGMYARDMAKALGCSEKTVRNRARKYKVTIPTPTRKTKFGIDGDTVRSKLRHQSVREMAEELGCSVDLIYYYKNNSKRSMQYE